jgi:PAS domain S-box-containing protein
MPLLSSIRSSYIPMAPLTSIAFLCLGGLLLVHSMDPSQGPLGILAAVLSALLSAYGLIELVEGLGIPVLSLEEWLFPDPPMMGAIPTGRMSPTTAAILLLSGAVVPMLFLRERGGERQKLFGDLAGCLGILVAVVGTVFVLSYLHGAPFLYGTLTIPMAATTALAALLLGTGQVLAVGPDGFPSRLFAGPSARARLLRVFVSTTVGVVVVINLMRVYTHWIFSEDNAFMSGVSTAAFAVITGALIARVALKVGDDMDRSEEVRAGAEDKLRESEDRFRDLVEHSQDLICTHDLEGRILSTNPWAASVLGYAPDEVLRMNFCDFLVPEVRHDFGKYLDEIRTHGTAQGLMWIQTRKGERRLWEYKNTLRTEGVAEPIVRGMAHDVTERQLSERALRESEEKFRAIFEDSKDGIILVDVDSKKFHMGNNTFCDMVQYTLDEIRHLGTLDVHPKEDVPWILEEFDRRARLETEKKMDIPVRRKDGSVFWADIKSSPVTIAGKKYMLGNFRDVTERRKAEESLARLGMAVDQSAEIIIITDREGTIQYLNPAFERITGYSAAEVIGKNPRILQSGKHDASFYREMWGALLRGEVWEGHFTNRKKDGSLYEEDATISPVRDSSGNIVSFVAVKKDVTRLLSLEMQVRTAQKMEAVGTLAGGIAHDFNNALTGIVGFGELLRLRMAGDEKSLHDLDEILHCAERAATLTRQLLTFARRQVIEPVNLNLSTLVADLMKFIGKVVGEHIEMKTSLEKNVPTICADRGQIEQVLMNLCLNARDAMPAGGRLVVETEDVYLEEEYVRRNLYMKTGKYALLTVSDTGIGMDEKTRERVFEPFFTTKGPDKGTGLGLAMVYGIVKQHGGFIHLYSEAGKGTTFKVYFPAVEAQPDAVPTIRREEIVRGGTETILLAEDEEALRALAERILTGFGYTVLVARNGEEAIEIFRKNNEIVLAVLDVVMPRKGGKEAFEEMHKQNPRLKVIFMSGYAPNGIHDSFVLIAGTPFLQKPFGPTILARKVREVLDTR